jgi:hypothetical protein
MNNSCLPVKIYDGDVESIKVSINADKSITYQGLTLSLAFLSLVVGASPSTVNLKQGLAAPLASAMTVITFSTDKQCSKSSLLGTHI